MLPNLHVPSDVPTLLVTLSSYFCILVSACLSMSQHVSAIKVSINCHLRCFGLYLCNFPAGAGLMEALPGRPWHVIHKLWRGAYWNTLKHVETYWNTLGMSHCHCTTTSAFRWSWYDVFERQTLCYSLVAISCPEGPWHLSLWTTGIQCRTNAEGAFAKHFMQIHCLIN